MLLLVQPSPVDPPGPLAGWLTDAGADLRVIDVAAGDELPADLDGVTGLVCLGGEMGAYDDAAHPWLARLRGLLARAVTAGTPTLGVCLGAQLLAAATGGTVRTLERPEIGAKLIAKRDAAWMDPLLADLPITPDVLQWHHDEVAELPPSAVLLAAAPGCQNQAFRVGERAWGFQFHFETTPELVRRWARDCPRDAERLRPDALTDATLAALHADLEHVWRPVIGRFVAIAAGRRYGDGPAAADHGDRAPDAGIRTRLPLVGG